MGVFLGFAGRRVRSFALYWQLDQRCCVGYKRTAWLVDLVYEVEGGFGSFFLVVRRVFVWVVVVLGWVVSGVKGGVMAGLL